MLPAHGVTWPGLLGLGPIALPCLTPTLHWVMPVNPGVQACLAHLAAYGVAHKDNILLWCAVLLDELGDLIPPEVGVVGCFPGLGAGPKPQEVDCQHCRAVGRFLFCAQGAAVTTCKLAQITPLCCSLRSAASFR